MDPKLIGLPAHTCAPLEWRLSDAPALSAQREGTFGTLLRRWANVDPDIDQPSLTHLYISLHLGGAKRLIRSGEGHTLTAEAALGAISIVSSGTAYKWRAQGPIDFAHLYLGPDHLEHVAVQEFDRQWRGVHMKDKLGVADPMISALLVEMIGATQDVDGPPPLYLDSITHALMFRLLRAHSSLGAVPVRARHNISSRRLKRVIDYVEANLSERIRLDDLAAVGGCSPFHFSRAFAESKGRSPYAYLIHRRVMRAKSLVEDREITLPAVAQRCGFNSVRQLSRMFKRETGATIVAWRRRA